jgi:transposase
MAPLVRRTWSPRGQTPILYQKTCSHKKVSVIAALCIAPCKSCFSLYFRLHPDSNINSSLVVSFLRCLLKELSGNLIILWDRFQPHRSRKVQELISSYDRLYLEYFPPYAPELNPVENVWSHTKMNSMVNLTALDIDTLASKSHKNLRSLQYKQILLRSFFKETGLSLLHR